MSNISIELVKQVAAERESNLIDEIYCLREKVKLLREALEEAERYIKNGLELGYIVPPKTGDPACETLPVICAALGQTKPKDGK